MYLLTLVQPLFQTTVNDVWWHIMKKYIKLFFAFFLQAFRSDANVNILILFDFWICIYWLEKFSINHFPFYLL